MTLLPSLDIVVVSFNARDVLRSCLESLRDDEAAGRRRIIVVDNASQDGSADVVQQVMPQAEVVRLQANMGFAGANNVGLRRGSSEVVLLLNSDTLVRKGQIDAMLTALGRTPNAAALGPRLVNAEGCVELSFGRMISPWNEAWQKGIGHLFASQARPVAMVVRRLTNRARRVDWVSGACLLVRRMDAEAVGLLDERYFMYAEDVDFCAALRARGRDVLYWPQAEIVHLRGASRRVVPEATERAYRESQLAFYAKHHPRWYPLLAWYLRAKGVFPK